MRHFTFTMFLLVFCLLGVSSYGQQKLTDFASSIQSQKKLNKPTGKETQQPSDIEILKMEGEVEFSFHRPTFEFEICTEGTVTEDFTPFVVNDGFCTHIGPLNSANFAPCFPAGTLELGFNLMTDINDDLLTVPPSLGFGNTDNIVLVNTFTEYMVMEFDAPDVYGVGWDYFDAVNAAIGKGGHTYEVNVYGAGLMLLGSTTFIGNSGLQFIGVFSDVPISRIEFMDTDPTVDGGAEHVANLIYGSCSNSGLQETVLGCEGYVEYDGEKEEYELGAYNCVYYNPYNTDVITLGHEEMCGDGEIIAYVAGVDPYAWAGIMMRENLSPGSKKISLARDNGNLARREARTTTNGTAYPQQFNGFGKNWLRLVRDGNFFLGYVSANGINWQQVMVVSIPMNECIEVGLFLTNKQFNSEVTATFSNVEINSDGLMLQQPNASGLVQTDNAVSVFPNPTSGSVTVDLGVLFEKKTTLELFNTSGQLVNSINLGVVDASHTELDLQSLPRGVYMLRVQAEGEAPIVERIVLQRK